MIHTITLSFPDKMFIEMNDRLGDEKDNTAVPKFTQFLIDAFTQIRRLKHNAVLTGAVPLKDGRKIELGDILKRKPIPSDSTWRLNDGKNVFKYDWKIGSKTYEALEFFCRFSEVESGRPVKCIEQVLSSVAIRAIILKLEEGIDAEFAEEDAEVHKKKKPINKKKQGKAQ